MTAVGSEQCTARSKRSGVRCQHRVIGGGVCHMHGGKSPQARRKRQERIALAQALAADPRRDPGEVLADVSHQADYLMRKARAEVDADSPTAETMTKLLELTETAGRWARSQLDAGTQERQTRVVEGQAVALIGVVRAILTRLDLTAEQHQLARIAVPEELRRVSAPAIEASK